jgi:hypothetical protein
MVISRGKNKEKQLGMQVVVRFDFAQGWNPEWISVNLGHGKQERSKT